MWKEAIEPRRRLLDERRVRVRRASTGRCRSGASCRSRCSSPTRRLWGATSSREDGHRQVGELGLGLCSFAVGVPPEHVKAKHRHLPGGGRRAAPTRSAPTSTTRRRHSPWCCARRLARRRGQTPASPSSGTRRPGPGSSARWRTGWPKRDQDLGNYAYAADMKTIDDDGSLDLLSLEYLAESGACGGRDSRRVPRGVPAVRGGRRRSAAVPREPVQDPPRRGHADDRADGHARPARVRLTDLRQDSSSSASSSAAVRNVSRSKPKTSPITRSTPRSS